VVLQPAQPLVGIGNFVEGLDHLGLELGLDGGKRERVLHIVVVEIAFAGRGPAALAFIAACSGAPLNGVTPAGAAGGADVCANTEAQGAGDATTALTIGWPSDPITGAGMALASGPA